MDRPTRSHPTLHPLTTLPPSPSYLYPTTSIPTTPSLLSRPSSQTHLRLSRPSSQTRLRPSRSTPTAVVNPTTTKNKKRTNNSNDKLDRDDWLTRTASALTMERLEEKGQAWRVKRESSTSLTDEDGDEGWDGGAGGRLKGVERGERGQERGQSRIQSRAQSRAQSRRGSTGAGGGGDCTRSELDEDIMPDFVNAEEEEEEEEEGEGEDVDEGEMKKVVLGRVGGWVDWAVGWMDFRTEEEGEEEGEEGGDDGAAGVEDGDGEAVVKGELDPRELQKRLRRKKKRGGEEGDGGEGVNIMSGAPEQAGLWSDAKWLLGVASKVAL